jgi:hypothetical protein
MLDTPDEHAGERERTVMDIYQKPSDLTPLCLWAAMGDEGNVMCFECKSESCWGCFAAWRRVDGKVEYYRQPIHGHCKA